MAAGAIPPISCVMTIEPWSSWLVPQGVPREVEDIVIGKSRNQR
jgi:hypothetical protein